MCIRDRGNKTFVAQNSDDILARCEALFLRALTSPLDSHHGSCNRRRSSLQVATESSDAQLGLRDTSVTLDQRTV
eukprot:5028115-Karenia_brevis.AAC.1